MKVKYDEKKVSTAAICHAILSARMVMMKACGSVGGPAYGTHCSRVEACVTVSLMHPFKQAS